MGAGGPGLIHNLIYPEGAPGPSPLGTGEVELSCLRAATAGSLPNDPALSRRESNIRLPPCPLPFVPHAKPRHFVANFGHFQPISYGAGRSYLRIHSFSNRSISPFKPPSRDSYGSFTINSTISSAFNQTRFFNVPIRDTCTRSFCSPISAPCSLSSVLDLSRPCTLSPC